MTDSIKILCVYVLFLICVICITKTTKAQVQVLSINADWNKENKVKWINELDSCNIDHIKLCKKPYIAKKYGVVVVPTIILLIDNKEVKRFEADLSFKMVATKEEVQKEINRYISKN